MPWNVHNLDPLSLMPFINITHHHHYEQNPHLEKLLMTVSTEVQNLLDLARQNSSMVVSVDAGMKALSAQVAALLAQIANQTPSLSDDDKAALTEAAGDLQTSITTLQSDIPANTSAGTADTLAKPTP